GKNWDTWKSKLRSPRRRSPLPLPRPRNRPESPCRRRFARACTFAGKINNNMIPAEKPQRRRGCLFWGGLIAGIFLLFALLAGYAGYRYVRHLVYEYTDTKPAP